MPLAANIVGMSDSNPIPQGSNQVVLSDECKREMRNDHLNVVREFLHNDFSMSSVSSDSSTVHKTMIPKMKVPIPALTSSTPHSDTILLPLHNRFSVLATTNVDDPSVQKKLLCPNNTPIVKVPINGHKIDLFLDTGAPVNLITQTSLSKFPGVTVKPTRENNLASVTDDALATLGEVELTLDFGEVSIKAPFVIVESAFFPGELLLGFETMRLKNISIFPADETITVNGKVVPMINICKCSENGALACVPYHQVSRDLSISFKNSQNGRHNFQVNSGGKGPVRRSPPVSLSSCNALAATSDDVQSLSAINKPIKTYGLAKTAHLLLKHEVYHMEVFLELGGYTTALSVPGTCKIKGIEIESTLLDVNPINNSVFVTLANLQDRNVRVKPGDKVLQFELLPDMKQFCTLPFPTIAVVQSREELVTMVRDTVKHEDVHYPEMLPALHGLLVKHNKIIPNDDVELTSTPVATHDIVLEAGVRPIYIPAYRQSHDKRELVEGIVEDMLKKGIVRPSKSPWNSPLLLVPKANGKWRAVVDYRRLNKVTVPDRYPIPVMLDLLRDVGRGNYYFSSIDLTSGFWQVDLTERSRALTAFSTPRGHYEFLKMPFGLKGSPPTFARIMNHVFHGLIGKTLHVYLDDILVCSKTKEEHLAQLDLVFTKLKEAHLLINPEKCKFLRSKLVFLGHVLDNEGLKTTDDKVKAIQQYPTPKSVTEVRSFLGLANFLRLYVDHFAHTAAPLTQLLKDGAKFSWSDEQDEAFEALKEKLSSTPVLIYPDFNEPFVIQTDACKTGVGAALMQRRDGQLRPIAYYSAKCSPAEQQYGITHLEGLAVIKALEQFREIIHGYKIEVHTDHQALTSFFVNGKNAHGRVGRWMLIFSEYDPLLKYIPGRTNVLADALSRNIAAVTNSVIDIDKIKIQQANDPLYSVIIQALNKCEPLPKVPGLPVKEFYLHDGALFRQSRPGKRSAQRDTYQQLVIPELFVPDLLSLIHNSVFAMHTGKDRCVKAARKLYFFPRQAVRIARYIDNCATCNEHKGHTTSPPPMLQYDVPDKPFDKVSIDLLSIPTTSAAGNQYVCVMIDAFSRYVELVALPSKTARVVADAFNERILLRHGAPKILQADNAGEFNNAVLDEICKRFNINKVNIVAYHPESNGLVERLNRTVLTAMRAILHDSHYYDWDLHLSEIQSHINSSYHESLGDTPFSVLYGYDVRLPYELLSSPATPVYNVDDYVHSLFHIKQETFKQVRTQLQLSSDRVASKQHKLAKTNNSIQVGRLVMVTRINKPGEDYKLSPRFKGPYRIVEVKHNKVRVSHLRDPDTDFWININRVKVIASDASETSVDPFLGVPE